MSEDDPDPTLGADRERLDKHVAMLSEHFDTVQIFVSRHNNEGTFMRSRGCGNFHARYGCVKEWVVHEEDQFRKG